MRELTRAEVIEALEYLISEDCCDTQHDYIREIEQAIELLRRDAEGTRTGSGSKSYGKTRSKQEVRQMENIICFVVGLFFGILLVALMEQARANTEPGHIECDKAVVYGDEEDDDEDDEECEDGE